MKSYYIREGDKRQGPYSVEQLRQMRINPAVQVWTQGLKQWIKAGEVPRLRQALFASSALPGSAKQYDHPEPDKHRFSLRNSWKPLLALFTLALVGMLLFNLKEPGDKATTVAVAQPENPVKKKISPKEQRRIKETSNPTAYIKGTFNWRKNLVGETVLEGTLRNWATSVDYKDVILQVTWMSKSDTPIRTTKHTLFEYLGAEKTIGYKLKVKGPAKHGDLKFKIFSATPVR
jgi:hypothetical protein